MERSYNKGISTIELLIALAVGTIMLSGIILLSFGGQTIRLDTELVQHGLYKAAAATDDAAAEVTTEWDGAVLGSATDGVYTRSASVSEVSPCLKLVGGGLDWTSEKDRAFTLGLETFVASIGMARALGGGCDPMSPGGWDTPGIQGGSDVSPGGSQGTAIAAASIGGTRYAFLTTVHSEASHNDFWIINAADSANPSVVSQLNTGKGLNDVVVANGYAYVVQNDKTNQLQTINVLDPLHPSLVNTVSFQPRGVDPTGSDPEGRVIYYYDGKLYVGLKTTVGPELLVFDVSANPAAPAFVGAISSAFNHSIFDIVVRGTYAYVATGHDAKEIKVLNISGATPVDTGRGFNTNASAAGEEDAKSLYLIGNTLYVGLERASATSERDFYALDISNPMSIASFGSKRIGIGPNTQVSAVAVQGRYAFLGTSDSNKEFQVWDVSDPAHMTQGSCGAVNLSQEVSGLKYINNLVFASIKSNQAFRVMYDTPSICTP